MAGGGTRFQGGAGGACEALLWEFRERPQRSLTEPTITTERAPGMLIIAAVTLDCALRRLRLSHPEFEVWRVTCLGLAILDSGSPLD